MTVEVGSVSSAIFAKYGKLGARFNMFVSKHEAAIEYYEKRYSDPKEAVRMALSTPADLKKLALEDLSQGNNGSSAESRETFIKQYPFVALAAIGSKAQEYTKMKADAVQKATEAHADASMLMNMLGEAPKPDIADAIEDAR